MQRKRSFMKLIFETEILSDDYRYPAHPYCQLSWRNHHGFDCRVSLYLSQRQEQIFINATTTATRKFDITKR
jgi:hypothetical protein